MLILHFFNIKHRILLRKCQGYQREFLKHKDVLCPNSPYISFQLGTALIVDV